MIDRAPQAEEAWERFVDRFRPVGSWLYAERTRLATAGVLFVTAWLFGHVMFGANGMVVYEQKRSEVQVLKKEIGELQQQNDRYSEEIRALKSDPKAIEKEAREQLHYARPGEVVFVSPAPVSPQKPATKSAKK